MKQQSEVEKIRAALGHNMFKWEPARWLDTGFPSLNKVLGHSKKGIPYGRLIEVSGLESHGKTAVALGLAATAQNDGARVLWLDYENSWDKDWAINLGLNADKVMVFAPYLGTFKKDGKDGEDRLVTDEELCDEVEAAVRGLPKAKGSRAMLVIDSLAAITPTAEEVATVHGQNLRTRMERPMFLSSLLRRWVKMAVCYNIAVIMVNQEVVT